MRNESIKDLLGDIERDRLSLPDFQREYVWTKPRIRDFFQSLYEEYPVGGVLLWETDSIRAVHRGEREPKRGFRTFIVDGQQRLTTLFGVMKGVAPPFYEGGEGIFASLNFDVQNEEFTYASDDLFCVNLRKLYGGGYAWIHRMAERFKEYEDHGEYAGRLTKLLDLQNNRFHVEVIPADRDLETVVDIFDKVNSRGTPINRADLCIAFLSTRWPKVRNELKAVSAKWQPFNWELQHLLRCMVVNQTGLANYTALHTSGLDRDGYVDGLKNTEKHMDVLFDHVSDYLGIDHDKVLMSRNSFPIMVHYLSVNGGFRNGQSEVLRLLCWYLHTHIWRLYRGADVGRLQVPLNLIADACNQEERLSTLMQYLRQERGELKVQPEHFDVSQVNSTYYPFLYVLARMCGARDFGTGVHLSRNMNQQLHLHHLFPKAVLREKYDNRDEINAIANFSFLTSHANLTIGDKRPEDYFPEVEEKCPGALESQWVPMKRELWKLENYPDFLAARRELLAKAANRLLSNLEAGHLPDA